MLHFVPLNVPLLPLARRVRTKGGGNYSGQGTHQPGEPACHERSLHGSDGLVGALGRVARAEPLARQCLRVNRLEEPRQAPAVVVSRLRGTYEREVEVEVEVEVELEVEVEVKVEVDVEVSEAEGGGGSQLARRPSRHLRAARRQWAC